MAEYLIDSGCNLVKVVPDLFQMTKRNWLFEDTDYLQQMMSAYHNTWRGEKSKE